MRTGDLTTLANVKAWLGLSGLNVSAITTASPAVLTLATRPSTPLLSGAAYSINGSTGLALPDGDYIITVIDPTHFSIPFDSSALDDYTGGAVVSITDQLLSRLISSCSAYIQSWLNRTVANATYTDTFDGTGGPVLMAPEFPITAVRFMSIDGIAINARPALGITASGNYSFGGQPGGYSWSDIAFQLTGGIFCFGFQNVTVTFDAGYKVNNEAQTIPADAPYELTTLAHWSAGDAGVIYASDGTAFLAVTGAPDVGQYSVSGSVYTFNAGDAGVDVLISYGFVPFDIEQAAVDTIGDWFVYRTRIDKTSQSIEGQSTTFVNTSLPARAKDVLMQYKKVAPIA